MRRFGGWKDLGLWVGLPVAVLGAIWLLTAGTSSGMRDLCESVEVGESVAEVAARARAQLGITGPIEDDYDRAGRLYTFESQGALLGKGSVRTGGAVCFVHFDRSDRVTRAVFVGRH